MPQTLLAFTARRIDQEIIFHQSRTRFIRVTKPRTGAFFTIDNKISICYRHPNRTILLGDRSMVGQRTLTP